MTTRPVNRVRVLVMFYGLLMPFNLFADSYGITPMEFSLLPPFCKFLNVGSGVAAPQGMPHAQHFCHGLKYVLRANSSLGNNYEERTALESAAGEFAYVINHTKPENKGGKYNKYLSMACTEKAKVHERLDETTESMKLFQLAIQYDPKLPNAYAGLSDLYQELGMNDEARKILELGLKRVPTSKSLQRRLKKL